jgi:hypothetical protein
MSEPPAPEQLGKERPCLLSERVRASTTGFTKQSVQQQLQGPCQQQQLGYGCSPQYRNAAASAIMLLLLSCLLLQLHLSTRW